MHRKMLYKIILFYKLRGIIYIFYETKIKKTFINFSFILNNNALLTLNKEYL